VAKTFDPLGDRVVVKPLVREAVSTGGIVLPDTAQEKPQEGEVVAIGPGRTNDDGQRVAMELKKGDTVIFAKYAGTEIKDGDDEIVILRESDILARLK